MQSIVGLDFETYSATDIKKHGVDRYVSDPHFRVLLASVTDGTTTVNIDFVKEMDAVSQLAGVLHGKTIVAHNAYFEACVLNHLGIAYDWGMLIDSAAFARAWGAGSKLAVAGPQILGIGKLDEGPDLIKLFCIPSKENRECDALEFDTGLPSRYPSEWIRFVEYCERDALLGLQIYKHVSLRSPLIKSDEMLFYRITMEMNGRGWPVDMEGVEQMQKIYFENLQNAEAAWHIDNPGYADFNVNSHVQLTKYCKERGIKAKSFDKKNLEKMMVAIEKRLDRIRNNGLVASQEQIEGYEEVLELFHLKKTLGGSSLKKLETIKNQVSEDSRLRDQYAHIGASQSFRTSGRGVQMQNLKRLDPSSTFWWQRLFQYPSMFTNDNLSANMRRLFCSSQPDGLLFVSDLSSIESRALAWQAGAEWKLEAYREGKDLYAVQAADFYGIRLEDVTKEQRTFGKVGELSCGYNAAGEAVQAFAEGMGVELTLTEAQDLVNKWRQINPEAVHYWADLHSLLNNTLTLGRGQQMSLTSGRGLVYTELRPAPESLTKQAGDPSLQSLLVHFSSTSGVEFTRVFHGIMRRGTVITYYRGSEIPGQLWKRTFTDPKTKKQREFTLYGGKLAGILTQSLCREIFFILLGRIHWTFEEVRNVELIGQFHDEVVLDWWPDPLGTTAAGVNTALHNCMTREVLPGLPLGATVESDYRYIK